MEAWQERVKVEREELNEKCTKLFDFLRSDKCPTGDDRLLLSFQLEAMIKYRNILDDRIGRF